MTPDQHAERAESLLETAQSYEDFRSPVKASLERQAIAHATLSLRAPKPAPRKKPGPKPKTTTKENDA